MRVYKPAAAEGYEWVLPVDDRDFEVFASFDGTPRRTSWVPVGVRLVREDDDGKPLRPSDSPWLGSHALVLRERAVTALGGLLAADAELLPLRCDDAQLTVVNVTRVVDALDLSRSAVVRFPSSGRIMQVPTPVFRPEALRGVNVYKVPEQLPGPTYVTDPVVRAAERAGLAGLDFPPVWQEEPSR